MTTNTSPVTWNRHTMKIKTKLDLYIGLKPELKEIPLSVGDYESLLKTIHPRDRHHYESDLWYHGRKLLRGGKK